jgi:tRNA-dihydrouridine synthase B
VDAIMIGRGAILDPWIFERIKHFLATGDLLPERPLHERVELLLLNLRLAIAHKGNERRATIEARKLYSGYLRGHRGVAKVRTDLMLLTSYAEIQTRLHDFANESKLETQAA